MPQPNPDSVHPGVLASSRHRIPVTSPADIDDEVRRWLKVAYEMDA